MRKDGKYRFTLQFGADSEDQIRVGELLEKLGNRKSMIIVSALSDYINAHPELQSGYSKIEVKVAPAFDRSQMERLIRSIVEESSTFSYILRLTSQNLRFEANAGFGISEAGIF